MIAMRVTEKMSHDDYWQDQRFEEKRPNLRQSIHKSRGDNIYHRNLETEEWIQEDSCHSRDDGTPNQDHISRDTKSDHVLVSDDFIYRGGGPAILIPEFDGVTVVHQSRNHKNCFSEETVNSFVNWVRSLVVQQL